MFVGSGQAAGNRWCGWFVVIAEGDFVHTRVVGLFKQNLHVIWSSGREYMGAGSFCCSFVAGEQLASQLLWISRLELAFVRVEFVTFPCLTKLPIPVASALGICLLLSA